MENYKTGLMGNGLITQDEKESKGYKKWVKETKKKSAWQPNDEYLEKLGFYGKKKKIAKKMGIKQLREKAYRDFYKKYPEEKKRMEESFPKGVGLGFKKLK